MKRLSPLYWSVVAIGAVFTLARFSEAFLILRAREGGLPTAFAPLVLIGMNIVYAAAAYPFGKLSDRMNHAKLLALGLAVLVAADVALACSTHWTWMGLGISLWGLHMGITQGLLAKLIADTAQESLRGTAYGVFNLISGIAMLAASAIAGLVWGRFGASRTFLAGAAFGALALAALWLRMRRRQTARL